MIYFKDLRNGGQQLRKPEKWENYNWENIRVERRRVLVLNQTLSQRQRSTPHGSFFDHSITFNSGCDFRSSFSSLYRISTRRRRPQ